MKLSTIFRVRGFIVDILGLLKRQDFKIDMLAVKAGTNEKKIDALQAEVGNHVMTKLKEHDDTLGEHSVVLKTIDGKLDRVISALEVKP